LLYQLSYVGEPKRPLFSIACASPQAARWWARGRLAPLTLRA
jgi:hypothetical protein